MTQAEFSIALDEALQKAHRAQAYTGGRYEIALLVSRDVYYFIARHAGTMLDVRGANCGVYHGFKIGIVNELECSNVVKAAILGMEYYNGMETNDIIVVGDENRLFQLESREPICFRDMGLTVSFGDENRTVTATVTNAAADAAMVTEDNATHQLTMEFRDGRLFFGDTPIDIPIGTLEEMEPANTTAQIPYIPRFNWDGSSLLESIDFQKPAEEPLTPGDTKMLDDFLGGFAIKGTLQPA